VHLRRVLRLWVEQTASDHVVCLITSLGKQKGVVLQRDIWAGRIIPSVVRNMSYYDMSQVSPIKYKVVQI
jgi:hypothetical protein